MNHPNVVHIYYVGGEAETRYLAMELVGEETLADQIKSGPLPFARIVRYGQQIAQALGAAARFDIVHGDVKPANSRRTNAPAYRLRSAVCTARTAAATGRALRGPRREPGRSLPSRDRAQSEPWIFTSLL